MAKCALDFMSVRPRHFSDGEAFKGDGEAGRRRAWSTEQKDRIVAESYESDRAFPCVLKAESILSSPQPPNKGCIFKRDMLRMLCFSMLKRLYL